MDTARVPGAGQLAERMQLRPVAARRTAGPTASEPMPATQRSSPSGIPEADRPGQPGHVGQQVPDVVLGARPDGHDQEDRRLGQRREHRLRFRGFHRQNPSTSDPLPG